MLIMEIWNECGVGYSGLNVVRNLDIDNIYICLEKN